jgi:sugar lactone lactonase YvrE
MTTKPTKALRRHTPTALRALVAAVLTFAAGGRADTLYVSTYTGLIQTVSTDSGAISLFADSLQGPMGMAFDGAGNLYVADRYAYQIIKVTPERTRTTFAATSATQEPWGLAFDRAGNLYCANHGENTITMYTPDGHASVFASTGLNHPTGLVFDQSGNLYVGNGGAGEGPGFIEKFTPDGTPSLFSDLGSRGPPCLAFDNAWRLYATSYYDDTVLRFAADGTATVFAHTGYEPMGLGFDSLGNLYVADAGDRTLEKFAPDGTHSLFASTGSYLEFIAIIPEPSACALLALGLPVLFAFRNPRKHCA